MGPCERIHGRKTQKDSGRLVDTERQGNERGCMQASHTESTQTTERKQQRSWISCRVCRPDAIARRTSIAAVALSVVSSLIESHILCTHLSGSLVLSHVKSHFAAHSRRHVICTAACQRREVNEHVAGTIVILNETKSFTVHEFLQRSCAGHGDLKVSASKDGAVA